MKNALLAMICLIPVGCEQSPHAAPNAFQPLSAANRNRLVIASAVPLSASVGWLEIAELDTGKILRAEQAISSDPVLRAFDGDERIFVLDRKPSDSLTVFDKATLKPVFPSVSLRSENERVTVNGQEHELQGNFQDLAVDNQGMLLLTRFNAKRLLKLDPNDGSVVEPRVSLADWSEGENEKGEKDGFPEMAHIRNVFGSIWIAALRLEGGQERSGWNVREPSALVRFNSRTNVAEGNELVLANAVTEFQPGLAGEMIVGAAGSYFDSTDGGIERIDRNTGKSKGVLVNEQSLGGNISRLASGGGKAFAIVWTSSGSQLVSVDLQTGSVQKGAAPTQDENLFCVVYDDERGLVYLAIGNYKAPSVVVVDPQSLKEKSRIPLEFLPLEIVLTD